MKPLNIGLQGSFEWLQARKNTFGASEASAMMGMSSYKTRDQLLKEKATGITPEVDSATQARFDRGHAIEADMRPVVEELINDDLYPVSGAYDDNELITASFDGLTMGRDICFECKTLNQKLRDSLSSGVIPDEYHPQLEQQLLVSGAEKAIFVAAQSTEDYLFAWYTSNPELRARIIAGWDQFAIDMENYQHVEKAAVVVGAPVMELPSITYRLNGLALQSNLADYKAAALQLVEDSKLPLETDQDFADRETLCKSFKSAEDKLKNIREQVVGEVQDIDKFCKEVEQIGELIRQARLAGEKQITARKDAIRLEIATSAANEFRDHIAEISKTIAPLHLPEIFADFAGAMKGKKTIDSLRSACNDLMAQKKIEASQILNKIVLNQNTLRELAADHAFLFADAQQLVLKENEDLIALIENRINAHKKQEEEKLEAEREKIRQEEAQKLAQAQEENKPAEVVPVAEAPAVEVPAATTSMPKVTRIVEAKIPTREEIINLVSGHWAMGAVQAEAYLVEYFNKKPAAKKSKAG
jgi:putative phage-type endonuclease